MLTLNKDDFSIRTIDISGIHEDWWFNVKAGSISESELLNRYGDMGLQKISGFVYSVDENMIGIEQMFTWNRQVITADDDELKNIAQMFTSGQKEV